MWQNNMENKLDDNFLAQDELAIVIPIYKNDLNPNEIISLKQVCMKLGNFQIFFLAPQGLVLGSAPKTIRYVYFPEENFNSVETYSRLMMNEDLYLRFTNYKYILIYQLDSFVFGNNVKYFLDMGYDYIGAPTLEGMYKPYRNEKVLFTQNGGFSLRNVKAFIKWIKDNKKEIELMCKYDAEDSIIYALRNKGLKLAPIDIALQFSFDSNVKECFRRTNGKLPLGCHAWERYAYEIWKPYIENLGYVTNAPSESKIIIKDYYHITKYNQSWIERYSSVLFREVLNKMIGQDVKEVYVWGMGKQGYEAMQLLLGAGINIKAFLDTNLQKVNDGMYPCVGKNVNEIVLSNAKIPIIIAMYNHVDACVWLEKHGFHHRLDYITYMELFQNFEVETMK